MIYSKKYFIVILFFFLISCNNDHSKLNITDFSRNQSILLEPYKFIPYSMFNLRIKGYVNDTIKIETVGAFNYKLQIIGKIDTLINSDYYGESPIKLTFSPYKATNGFLEIDLKL